MRATCFAVAAFIASTASSRDAAAELPPPHDAGCRGSSAFVASSLPANVPGIPFYPYASTVARASLSASDGSSVPTRFVVDDDRMNGVLELAEQLTPGVAYTVTWDDDCEVLKTARFTAGDVVPLPTTAGTVTVSEQRPPTEDARCYAGKPLWPAQRIIIMDADPNLIPFLPVSVLAEIIDGEVPYWSYRQWGSYHDGDPYAGSMHMSCPASPATQSVAMRVRIAGGPTLLTPTIKSELRCFDTIPGGCPPDPPSTFDGGTGSGYGAGKTGPAPSCAMGRSSTAIGWIAIATGLLAIARRARRT